MLSPDLAGHVGQDGEGRQDLEAPDGVALTLSVGGGSGGLARGGVDRARRGEEQGRQASEETFHPCAKLKVRHTEL